MREALTQDIQRSRFLGVPPCAVQASGTEIEHQVSFQTPASGLCETMKSYTNEIITTTQPIGCCTVTIRPNG